VGQGLAQALGTLDQAMLKAQPDARGGDRVVVRQKPGAGAEVAPGTVVALSTQRYERVPAVIGLRLPEAQTRLAQSNLAASPDDNERAASRKVYRQVPADGERVPVGRGVQLFTHVEVAVPDVLKQRLPAASAALAQSGLRAKPDRGDYAAEREVRAQRPAPRTLAPEQSEVALDTRRLVTVPALTGTSCKAAGELATKAGLRFAGCDVQSVLPLVLGEATVSEQSPPANAVVDEGTSIIARAQPPRWSAPVLLLLMGAALSALGLWIAKKIWPPKPRTPLSPVQPPPATLLWRVAPDRNPGCSLRLASGSDDESPASGSLPPIRWRVVSEEPLTCLRSSEALEGDNHDHQD
jgi:beta-lactam-binding protein with PASTA domain